MTANRPRLDIVGAFESPALFEPWYRGISWWGWKVILKAAYAIPLDLEELTFFHEVSGGRDPPKRRVRELWAICSQKPCDARDRDRV